MNTASVSCSTPCAIAAPLDSANVCSGWMYCRRSRMKLELSCAMLAQYARARSPRIGIWPTHGGGSGGPSSRSSLPWSSNSLAFCASETPTMTTGASTTNATANVTSNEATVTPPRTTRWAQTNTGQVAQHRMIARITAVRNGCSTR